MRFEMSDGKSIPSGSAAETALTSHVRKTGKKKGKNGKVKIKREELNEQEW